VKWVSVILFDRYLNRFTDILAGNFGQSTVVEFIEELIIDGGQNAIPALRLICLQSLTYNGLNARVWNEYQRLLVQVC
jgi:hypothetical protein